MLQEKQGGYDSSRIDDNHLDTIDKILQCNYSRATQHKHFSTNATQL